MYQCNNVDLYDFSYIFTNKNLKNTQNIKHYCIVNTAYI